MQIRNKSFKLNFKLSNKAFTLIELIVVIAIITILSSLAILGYSNIQAKARTEVCNYNRVNLEKEYQGFLILNNLNHNETIFSEFINKHSEKFLCPDNGEFSFENEKIVCSKHDETILSEDGDESVPLEPVPYLKIRYKFFR